MVHLYLGTDAWKDLHKMTGTKVRYSQRTNILNIWTGNENPMGQDSDIIIGFIFLSDRVILGGIVH